jgi:hypothetical protein
VNAESRRRFVAVCLDCADPVALTTSHLPPLELLSQKENSAGVRVAGGQPPVSPGASVVHL